MIPMNLGGIAENELISKKHTAYKIDRPPSVNATGNP